MMRRWAEVGTFCWIWLLVLVAAILLQQPGEVDCCVEEERIALLHLKAYMNSYSNPITNGSHVMPWSDIGARDCCKWNEVICDVSTGRAIALHLGRKVARDYYEDAMKKPWFFNVTLFRPFNQLKSLDLSDNGINGLVEDDGSTNISTLKNLQVLILSHNNFQNGYISVSDLTSLRTLNLDGTGLNEARFPLSKELANISMLQTLNLMFNSFSLDIQVIMCLSDQINQTVAGTWLCKMRNLQELFLLKNSFKGSIPPCLRNLTSLRVLDLSYNKFEGKLSLRSFANHSKLEELVLSTNSLQVQTEDASWTPTFQLLYLGLDECSLNKPHGNIPTFLSHQYNLTGIFLSSNDLVGPFPTWLFSNNSQLKILDLWNNSLTGHLQLPHLVKGHGGLNSLDISSNNIGGALPKSLVSAFPYLETLDVSDNKFQGQIPSSLCSMQRLSDLNLSRNNFSGEVPSQLFSNCSSLVYLFLADNNFGGTINDALIKSSNVLQHFDISNNKVIGRLPNWMGNLSALAILSASNNFLEGRIPLKLCKLQLGYLDLSENYFTEVPLCYNHSSLQYLNLRKNYISGSLPDVLSNFVNLITLDLSDNQIMGSIPRWINKYQKLRVLQLGGNKLQGQIPLEMCELSYLDILDLSSNNLSGKLPPCFINMSFGNRIHDYSYFGFYGEFIILVKNVYITYQGYNEQNMSALDLSCNKLSGFIPPDLGELEHLHSLNLSHNSLSGPIPNSFSDLKQIESLDLSFNNLCSEIPSQLAELNNLEIFNVSYNKLTGRVPTTGQFGSFYDSYYGNPGLHGLPWGELPNHTEPLQHDKDGDHERTFMGNFLWTFGMSCAVLFLATIGIMYINTQWRQASFDFMDRYFLWWLPMSWRSLY